MKHYKSVVVLSNFQCQTPLHKRKGPLFSVEVATYRIQAMSRVARWPVFHRPGQYFTANLAETGKRPVFKKI